MLSGCAVWMAPGNKLGAGGEEAALAVALSKLVNLTSLNLARTWNVEWPASCVCVCVCVRACGVVIAVVVGAA